ncbi:DUF342 domain-containing protein [Aliidiomarina sp. B3213]|nr:FapA family protein [Aliidiomarina sp. B3213]RTE86239.1 DUF342 domain-containing protein [Aliidiomarina sp. B3213]
MFRASDVKDIKLIDDIWTSLPEAFEAGLLDAPEKWVSIKIGDRQNASLTFKISDDKMEAEAIVTAPYGGVSFSTEQVLNYLRNAHITNGIRKKAIEQIVIHTKEAPPGALLTITIARGRQPRNGVDAKFKPLVEDARQRVLKPQSKDQHRVDMRDLGSVVSVKEGVEILERIPPKPGRPGVTVTGDTLKAEDGKDQQIKAGKGTEISKKNPNRLVATVTGMPSFVDNSCSVDDVLALKGVDVSTGHIDFDGSVFVNGNVTPGMRVFAEGDVTVNGYVDSANIRAKGNITVTKGVIGHQRDPELLDEDGNYPSHSTRIVADGSIWLNYSQYATLIPQHGLFVEKQLTHCQVITPGKIHIGGEGSAANGKVIGGQLEIADDVFVGQLGAPAGTRTRVLFNVEATAPANLEEQLELADKLAKLVTQKKKLLKAKEKFLEQPKAFKKGFGKALQKALQRVQHEIMMSKNRLEFLHSQEVQHNPIRVRVNKVTHVGAEFLFNEKAQRLHEPRGPSTILLKEGKIKFE